MPGEFSVRGGILDLFAWDWLDPVRIELFDDQIESIRRFDVATQRSLESMDHLEITVLGSHREVGGCLTDYLGSGSLCLLVEPSQMQAEATHLMERAEDPEELLTFNSVQKKLTQFGTVFAAELASGSESVMERLKVESVERFSGDIARVRQELDRTATEHEVFLIAETQAEIKRLNEILQPTELAQTERLHYVKGRLRSGFRYVGEDVLVVSGNELFHRAPLRRTSRHRMGKAIQSFLDLRNGDLVVHLAHGIGRYRGLQLIRKEDYAEEHLEIEFHGGTKIFVPATKIDLVQKYVGARKTRPRLATIGGKNWLKQKQAAASAVEDLAADLLELQAQRQSRPGITFPSDTEWQQEFDAAFPYTETDDQLMSIESIKSDMELPRPMDRLVCGDVGFGKTEVAMRAAFKAVDSGYQVAILVPTTILAEQHHRTFTERMSEFPFTIRKLSRFCTAKEQRETIEDLKEGKVDVVIGTHRLASRDVSFNNLGLLVIDEEQRFGVEVKERLKAIRSSIDVLTLSATPIPRTLHMSLTGIRDISNLETPPEDRVAVETRVTRWDHDLIRHAILRELNRDGQVFFVHNRIHDIEALADRLRYIVPEASIAIGHGQMPEGQLEKVMVDFVQHRFDVLLATTIVESGLDIPNANTIFIDDADRYGLADLHQLRGRVGRYKHRAYCYMLVDPAKAVTPNAARRLRAIEEFSDMGAGFSIAMRDLEIRGAGNVLGTQQSGHISLVGYELYCQLLDAAVRRMRNLAPKLSADVNIELPVQAFIPRSYVPDMRAKIDLYRRLSECLGDEPIAQMRQEFVDRFGPPPEPVERLLELTQLKSDAAFWQIDAIHTEDQYLVFGYTDRSRAEQLVKASKGRLRIVDDRSIYLTLPKGDQSSQQVLATIKAVLRTE
jgi:transcription-repair coupling factor (superfamily II helicase)